jgi:hypothetical protein
MFRMLPSLTHIDEVSTLLLSLREQWLCDNGFDHWNNRYSSSLKEAQRRALVQVANRWLADLSRQGKKIVVASRYCSRYSEGDLHLSEDGPWTTTQVTTASELFEFAYGDCNNCGNHPHRPYDDWSYNEAYCFITK